MDNAPLQINQTLIGETDLQNRVRELGTQISKDYPDDLLIVGILKGALYFLADLSRAVTSPVQMDLIAVASYTGTESSGTVTLLKDLDIEIADRHVLIVEDIVDTGRTLHALLALLQDRSPKTLKVCTLLNKPDRRLIEVPIDYCGFTIDDHFVVGYGLDYNQSYRNLPYIAILK